jgi:ribA/ribD-fused uncharacterized protein
MNTNIDDEPAVSSTGSDAGPITSFTGPYAWLSNFHRLATPITYNGLAFINVEAAYQAQKTLVEVERLAISKMYTAMAAKQAGKHVKLRADWETVKVAVMAELIALKFDPEQQTPLAVKLYETGARELVEGNTWCDVFWGECRCKEHVIRDGESDRVTGRGTGENWLGRILETVREGL